jgi:hypothetical protein
MATILQLENSGMLFKYDAVLGRRQQEFRRFYTSQRLMDWMLKELPAAGSTWNLELTPAEQLDAVLNIFVSGEVLTYKHNFKPILPVGNGVWEIKTADVRIFGWFPEIDCFVGVAADLAQRVKEIRLYAGYRDEVVRYRDNLDLDEPKFLEGELPNGIISNFDYP